MAPHAIVFRASTLLILLLVFDRAFTHPANEASRYGDYQLEEELLNHISNIIDESAAQVEKTKLKPKDNSNPLLIGGSNLNNEQNQGNTDDEGLTPERERDSYFVETGNGEEHTRVKFPESPDATTTEEEIHRMQGQLLGTGVSKEIIRLLGKAIAETELPATEILKKIPSGKRILKQMENPQRRSSYTVSTSNKWEKGIIPYTFGAGIASKNKEGTQKAMEYMEKYSCLRFVPYGSSEYHSAGLSHGTYLKFIDGPKGGCWSYVGRSMDGEQEIAPCGEYGIGTPLHEILHALSGDHEQSRPDRDEWIQVLYKNMKKGEDNGNFRKEKLDTKVPYDYSSVMQYGLGDFSINDKPVMTIYDNHLEFLIGEREGLSFYDLKNLNLYYDCTETKCKDFGIQCRNEGFVGYVDGACKCVCPFGFEGDACTHIVSKGCGTNHQVNFGDSVTIASPNYPEVYGDNLECLYYIESPKGSKLKLEFLDMQIEHSGEPVTCYDSLEIRFHMLGQPGTRFCGNYYTGSVVSDINQVFLIFRSDHSNGEKGFRIKASTLTDSDFAYDLSNRGLTYNGDISYTIRYKKCLKWDEIPACPVRLGAQNYQTGLGSHNHCRNPTGAEQPWCYTDADTCRTDICDVSGIYTCHDIKNDCEEKVRTDASYCTTNAAAFEECHKTCSFCMNPTNNNNENNNNNNENNNNNNENNNNNNNNNENNINDVNSLDAVDAEDPVDPECPDDYFLCVGDDKCIPEAWRCDRDSDCSESEDEAGCVFTTTPAATAQCSDDEFLCVGDNRCISGSWRCDREGDCSESEDEAGCVYPTTPAPMTTQCQSEQFYCAEDDKCIIGEWQCDNYPDCSDGTDELGCDICTSDQFKCSDGMCIANSWHCDGVDDCADGGDEVECDICTSDQFKCSDGKCIANSWHCDEEDDCSDGSDEVGCSSDSAERKNFSFIFNALLICFTHIHRRV